MNFGKIRSKKVSFCVGLAILLVVSGAFLFYVWKETKENEIPLYVETGDFNIEENNGVKIIKNDKIGFSVEIPKDWKVDESFDKFTFTTPDFQPNLEKKHSFPVPKTGCFINMSIGNDIDRYNYINDLLSSCLANSYCDYEIIKINGINALKHSSENAEIGIVSDIVNFLRNNNIYFFELYSSTSDKQKCSDVFDNFLNKIKLN